MMKINNLAKLGLGLGGTTLVILVACRDRFQEHAPRVLLGQMEKDAKDDDNDFGFEGDKTKVHLRGPSSTKEIQLRGRIDIERSSDDSFMDVVKEASKVDEITMFIMANLSNISKHAKKDP